MEKIENAGFRDLYHQFIYVRCPSLVSRMIDTSSHLGFVIYVYADNEQGLSGQPLCLASYDGETMSMDPLPDDSTMYVFRFRNNNGFHVQDAGEGARFMIADIGDQDEYVNMNIFSGFAEEYEDFRKYLEQQYESEYPELTILRNIGDIDEFRHRSFVDNLKVLLLRSDTPEIEGVWVKGLSFDGSVIKGIVLNEPVRDYGIHKGDEIDVIPYVGENGEKNLIYFYEPKTA